MTAEELLWPILEQVAVFVCLFSTVLLGFSMLRLIGAK